MAVLQPDSSRNYDQLDEQAIAHTWARQIAKIKGI